MRNRRNLLASLSLTAMIAASGPASAEVPLGDTGDPINIPLHNWSSQLVNAHIVGQLFEKAGYEAKYVSTNSQVVYTSMCEGDIHLVQEVWEGAFGEAFEKQIAKDCVIDVATHDAITREEWWYPSYVEEECPGLPDWKALNECAELFATPETAPKGRFLGGPVDWLKHDAERVEALDMDFEVVNAGSAAALWAELKSAHQRKEPIVLFNWTPNWVGAVYDGDFVEFPEYEPECKEDPSWGINPNKTHDCGNPADGYLKIGAWEGFPDKWPAAYRILEQVNFTNDELAVMSNLVDTEGLKPAEAASKWLADNKAKWEPWIEGVVD